MGWHISWTPINQMESLQSAYQTLTSWPDLTNPKEIYRQNKWLKSVGIPLTYEELHELLANYRPKLIVEAGDPSDYYLPMPYGEPVNLWLTIREDADGNDVVRSITAKLGANQQSDQKCLDRTYHFFAYLCMRGHRLVDAEQMGWLNPEWLEKTGEGLEPIPVYSRYLKVLKRPMRIVNRESRRKPRK